MPSPLPAPVQRWVERLDGSQGVFRTARIEGASHFRRRGRGLWLPIEATMWHELGRHHVVDLRVGLGPLSIVRGLDGYVDGTGFSRISHTLDIGPEIDQASLLFMWSEAILFPSAWKDRDDVAWEGIEPLRAKLTLPAPNELVPAELRFDPDSGLPARFSAQRYKGIGSSTVEWSVDYADWGPTEDGVTLPATATVTWADEPGPWFRMHIRRANPGADVRDAIERGRAVLAEAAADPTRRPPAKPR